MKVAILGAAGRMGQMLVKLAEADPALSVVAQIDVADGYDTTWPEETEAVVDFSFHAAVAPNVEKAAAQGLAYVIGTTGLTPDEQARVDACSAKIPVVQAANYSLGVNLLLALVRQAAAVLGPQYDVEVVEMHHRHKKDAPSGTALMLAHAAAEGRGVKLDDVACYGRKGLVGERPAGEIALHALRGGSVVGDHTVMFAKNMEILEPTHRAISRESLAEGCIQSIKWVAARKDGEVHSMIEVLGLC